MMQSLTRLGPGNDSQPKPNGNSPPAAGPLPTHAIGGATISVPAESTCATLSPGISPTTPPPAPATPEPAPGPPSPRTATAYTTWPATSGNGAAIPIAPTLSNNAPPAVAAPIPKAPPTASIPALP